MINELVTRINKQMTDAEQCHAQAIDILEDRIAKLESKHEVVTKQNEVLMEMLSKLMRGNNE